MQATSKDGNMLACLGLSKSEKRKGHQDLIFVSTQLYFIFFTI